MEGTTPRRRIVFAVPDVFDARLSGIGNVSDSEPLIWGSADGLSRQEHKRLQTLLYQDKMSVFFASLTHAP